MPYVLKELDIPIYQQLVDTIRIAVKRGELQPGQQLPTVQEMSKELSIARGTIKRAYDELERLHFVEKVQGRKKALRTIADRVAENIENAAEQELILLHADAEEEAEQLREDLRPQAEFAIRSRAAIDEIVQIEGLEADKEDIAQALAVICRHNNITMDELKEQYDAALEQAVINSVLTGKVMHLIRDAAIVEEK